MNKTIKIIIMISLILTSCSASSEVNEKWVGQYKYVTNLGETAGGSPIWQHMLFDIKMVDGKLQCLYYEDGWQTMRRINLIGEVEGDMLKLYFDSWGKDGIVPLASIERFKKGNLLNTMQFKDGKYIVKFLNDEFMPDDYVFEKGVWEVID